MKYNIGKSNWIMYCISASKQHLAGHFIVHTMLKVLWQPSALFGPIAVSSTKISKVKSLCI